MNKLYHKIAAKSILLFVSLPFFILDFFSYFNFILIRYVFQYRLKLVKANIIRSFPQKTKKEIHKIINRYYLHFSDLLFEAMKVGSFSEKQYKKHIKYTNINELNRFYEQKRNVILLAGHFSNWEIVSSLPMFTQYNVLAVYKPLKNKFWNEFLIFLREKFGSHTVSMRKTLKVLSNYNTNNKQYILGLVSDQHPPRRHIIWAKFMGQDTAYYPGPEKIAKSQNAVVMYLSVRKIKRHKYEASFHTITETPNEMQEGEIIQAFSNLLEKDVKAQPELYIWSHKRWRYKPND